MLSKQRLLLIVLVTGLVFSLSACLGNVNYLTPYPTPTAIFFRFPEKDILPSPTFTTTEVFDCWTAPATRSPARGRFDSGSLVIGYSITGSSGDVNLYRFDLAGKKYSSLAANIQKYTHVKRPISPDGQYLWYAFYARPANVAFVYNFADTTARQVPFPPLDLRKNSLDWSPDGRCLFIWQENTVVAYRLLDGALQERTFPTVDFSFEKIVASSPDGRWWAWDCKTSFQPQSPHEQNFCLMSPEGQRIDHDGLHLPVTSEQVSGFFSVSSFGCWSPDSHVLAIAYAGHRSDYQDAVRLIHMDETGVSSFEDIDLMERMVIRDLQWSPDGRQLLILNSAGRLYIYHPATQEMTTIPAPDGNYLEVAAWLPNRKQIAVVTVDKQYKFSLYVMNADGTNTSQLPTLPQEAEGAEMVAPTYWIDQVYWVR